MINFDKNRQISTQGFHLAGMADWLRCTEEVKREDSCHATTVTHPDESMGFTFDFDDIAIEVTALAAVKLREHYLISFDRSRLHFTCQNAQKCMKLKRHCIQAMKFIHTTVGATTVTTTRLLLRPCSCPQKPDYS